MNPETALTQLAQGLYMALLLAMPLLLAVLATGVVVGILQAATSINEQTLTFVPKLAVTALVLVVLGASMMGLVADFTREIFAAIAGISR